jgi:hypothetical protein
MVYRPKRDLWIAAVVIFAALLELGMGLFLTGAAFFSRQPALLIPAALTGSIGLLLSWCCLGSYYEVTDADLLIHCGPLRFQLALEELIDVHSTKRLKADFGWGLAWSLDRVRIRCRRRMLPFWISPADKAAFIQDLIRARPDLKVSED